MATSRPRATRSSLVFSCAVALALGACSPDPGKSYDDFLDRIPDASIPPDAPVLAQIPDITGRFLIGMAGSPQPNSPFHFIAVNEMTDNGDGTATLTSTLTALTIADKTLVGDVNMFPSTQISKTGQFEAELMKAIVPATADPILGAELTIEPFTALATIVSKDVYCGDITGFLTNPLLRDLAGSTFGAIRVSDDAIGASLPPVTPRCTAGDPDAGVPDASVPDAATTDADTTDADTTDADTTDADTTDADTTDANTSGAA